MRWLPWVVVLGVVGAGCEATGGGKDTGSDSGSTGGGGDDDDDNGGGGDDDDDNGTPTTTTPADELDCDATYATPAPGGDLGSCITEEIHCGDQIYGTIEGGSSTYDYDFWLEMQALDALFGEYEALDGQERSYVFRDTAVNDAIRVTVHTCFDMWATWIARDGSPFCDVTDGQGSVFESGTGTIWYTERIDPGGEYQWEFVIEGLYGATGNYVISVECF